MAADPRTEPYPMDGTKSTPPPSEEWVVGERLELAIGLLEAKHRRALGPAWHLYLYLLSRKPFKSPFVAKGKPIPIGILAWVEGVDRRPDGRMLKDGGERVIQRWLARLRRHGYIATEAINPGRARDSGVRIRILKAKEWRAGRMRRIKDPPTKMSGGVPTEVSGGSAVQARDTARCGVSPPEAKILPRE